jgi:PAS domain S-box-containing protein
VHFREGGCLRTLPESNPKSADRSIINAPGAQARNEATEWFAKLFYANPVPAAITAYPNGRLLDANEAFVRTFGFERSELLGRTAVSLGIYASPRDREDLVDLVRKHGFVRGVEVMCYAKSGALLHMLMFVERIELEGQPCLLTMAYDFTERKRIENDLRRSEAYLAEGQRVSHTGTWALNPRSGTLFWSQEMYRISGFDPSDPPPSYAELISRIHPEDRSRVDESIQRAIQAGEDFEGEYRIFMPDGMLKYLHYLGHPVIPAKGEKVEYVGTVMDVTAQKLAEAKLNSTLNEVRTLAARLMHAQDYERRRIARELHETTAQDLAALKMNLAALDRGAGPAHHKDRALLAESIELAERAMMDIRTLSYLLHPPLLDEAGLPSAIRWFATGFAKRSGVRVELSVPDKFERLPEDVEIALFRVVQESLINIHRHAQSPSASISLTRHDDELRLEVRDEGRGLPRARGVVQQSNHQKLGVGIASMRERLEELNGHLALESTRAGTRVIATLTLPRVTG